LEVAVARSWNYTLALSARDRKRLSVSRRKSLKVEKDAVHGRDSKDTV